MSFKNLVKKLKPTKVRKPAQLIRYINEDENLKIVKQNVKKENSNG